MSFHILCLEKRMKVKKKPVLRAYTHNVTYTCLHVITKYVEKEDCVRKAYVHSFQLNRNGW